jgi:O-antigen polymerase
MNTFPASDASQWRQLGVATCKMIFFVGLVFTFFNALAIGFSSSIAPSLVGWLSASVVTACLVMFMQKEKLNWATLLFFAAFVCIALRRGPVPLHALALGLIVLTMACAAHSAILLARVSGWATVFAMAIVLAATLNALVALYQYFGFSIQYPIPYLHMTPQGIAMGQVKQRNQMAILCVLGLVTLAYFPAKFRWAGITRFGLGLCLIAAVAASASRIGAVAIFLFSCTLLFTASSLAKSSRQLVGLAFPTFLILVYAMPWIVDDKAGLISRFTDDTFSLPCNSRLLLWRNAFSLLWESPLAGLGWGGFIGKYYISDLPARGCELLDHAHNVYLQIAVEAGIPAAVLLIFGSAWFFVKHMPTVRVDSIYRWSYFSVCTIWLYAQTDFPLWVTGFLWLFSIFLGLIASQERIGADSAGVMKPKWLSIDLRPWLIVPIAVVTACLSVLALIQYLRVSSIATSVNAEEQIAARGYPALFRENWMFSNHLEFMAAQSLDLNEATAEKVNKFCVSVLTYSPEPSIIMCVIRSAYLMGDMKQVEFHKQRMLTIYGDQVYVYKKELDSLK